MPTTWLAYLFVGIGGAGGAMARFALNVALQRGTNYPWGTLSANLLGCLLMGVIAQLVAGSSWFNSSGLIPDQYRLLFAVGFCGSFTTLSALVLELHTMLGRNDWLSAAGYIAASVLGGFVCLLLGFLVARGVLAASG